VDLEVDKVREKRIKIWFYIGLFVFIDNRYKATVYTGKKLGAGTDAEVFITLYGDQGESGPIVLKDKKNNFESGQCVFKYFL